MGYQAGRALGDSSGSSGGVRMPGAMIPRRLPSINLPQSPTSPRPSIGAIPEDKGKGPSNGKIVPKKGSPHASSDEDVSGAEGTGSGTALSPPFSPTRPLRPIAGRNSLPPIVDVLRPPVRSPPARLSLTTSLAGSMPTRRGPVDPFASEAVVPLSPTRASQPPLSPIRVGQAPLSPIRAPPTRPSIGRAPPTPFALGLVSPTKKTSSAQPVSLGEGTEVPTTEDGQLAEESSEP